MQGRLFLISGSDTTAIGLELTNDATTWEERPSMALKGRHLAGVVYANDETHFQIASKQAVQDNIYVFFSLFVCPINCIGYVSML